LKALRVVASYLKQQRRSTAATDGKPTMKTCGTIAALAALTAAPMAQAMLLDWRVTSEYGTDMGGFKLDFAQP
jgi:hypothetical protein